MAWLFAARIVQGVATALVAAGVSAALIDLQPPGRAGLGPLVNAVTPTAGLALGAVVARALVQYAPAPLRLTYTLILLSCLVMLVLVARMTDSTTERHPLDLHPRVGVEPHLCAAFLAVLPCLIAVWALGGLYLSLGPSLLLELTHSHNRLLGASIVFTLCAPGALVSVLTMRWSHNRPCEVAAGFSSGGWP